MNKFQDDGQIQYAEAIGLLKNNKCWVILNRSNLNICIPEEKSHFSQYKSPRVYSSPLNRLGLMLSLKVFFKAQVSPCPNIWLKHTLPQGLVIAVPITVCHAVKLKADKQQTKGI